MAAWPAWPAPSDAVFYDRGTGFSFLEVAVSKQDTVAGKQYAGDNAALQTSKMSGGCKLLERAWREAQSRIACPRHNAVTFEALTILCDRLPISSNDTLFLPPTLYYPSPAELHLRSLRL